MINRKLYLGTLNQQIYMMTLLLFKIGLYYALNIIFHFLLDLDIFILQLTISFNIHAGKKNVCME